MRRLLNKPWFVAILAIAAIGLVCMQTLDLGGTRSVVPIEESYEEEMADGTLEQPADAALFALLSTYTPSESLRDPFAVRAKPSADRVVVEVAPPPKEAFRLSAVWVQGGSTLAVLNGRICSPGETLGQLTLESVNPTGVWVLHAHGRDFVSVGQEILLSPANQPLPPAPLLARGEI